MSHRVTLALLVAVLATAGMLWLDPDPPSEAPPPPAAQGTPLVAVDPADITTIRLRTGEAIAEISRAAGGTWTLGRPSFADDLLRAVADAVEIQRIEPPPPDLAQFGLDPPHRTLELRGGPAPVVLAVGDRTPATTGLYVRVGREGPVAVTGALLLWELDKLWRAARAAPSPTVAHKPAL